MIVITKEIIVLPQEAILARRNFREKKYGLHK